MRTPLILFLLLASSVFAADGANKTVTKSRELLVQKDRLGAIQVLLRAIEESKKDAEKSELIKELKNTSTIFLTEDGQKTFELAESLLYTASSGADAKYDEALAREPNNLQVVLGRVRSRLAKNDCAGAEDILIDADKINPYSLERKYLRTRVAACLKRPIKKSEPEIQKSELKQFWTLLQAQALVENQKLREAQDLLKELGDWDMPEVSYWRFKSLDIESSDAVDFAQKYIDQCKALSASVRRKYKWEPRLCFHDVEAEEFVKRSEAAR